MTICENAGALIEELKQEMALFIEELRTLDEYIRNAQEIVEMAQQVGVLKKKLAWYLVYDMQKKVHKTLRSFSAAFQPVRERLMKLRWLPKVCRRPSARSELQLLASLKHLMNRGIPRMSFIKSSHV